MGRAGKPGEAAPGSPGEFMARWSRRKIEARDAVVQPDDPDATAVLPPEAGTDVTPVREPEQELTDADMPPLESLNAESDFAAFMSSGVSDGLRQKALRILFNQPEYNITDGLNDYDDDYTQFASLGSIVTHEMKRMLMRELEAEQNAQQQAGARPPEPGPADTDISAEAPAGPSPEPVQSAEPGQPDTDAGASADQGQAAPGEILP